MALRITPNLEDQVIFFEFFFLYALQIPQPTARQRYWFWSAPGILFPRYPPYLGAFPYPPLREAPQGRPIYMGTAVAQWIRCCATNRKVAGSIPDDIIGIFR